jgi:hypothetical protein
MTGVGWSPAAADAAPWLEITLKKKLKTNQIVLSHGRPSSPRFGDFTITINGKDKDAIKGSMTPDHRVKTVIQLEKPLPVGSLRIDFAGGPFEKPPSLGEVELRRVR